MAIVDANDILSYMEVQEGEDADIIEVIHLAVEAYVKKYCRRDFESTSYRDRYDGTGYNKLVLDNFPVTAITRLSLWPIDVVMIKNTSTYTIATISTSSTALTLTKDGSTVASLAFSTYSTLSTLVTQINTYSGWVSQTVSPSYDNFQSTQLIERMGLYCLESNWAYLQMPYNRAEIDFDVDANKGIIHLSSGIFPAGTRNIFVDYTAGYSSTTMPKDIQLAIKIITKYVYDRMREESFGYSSFNLGDVSGSFEQIGIPTSAKMIMDGYKRILI